MFEIFIQFFGVIGKNVYVLGVDFRNLAIIFTLYLYFSRLPIHIIFIFLQVLMSISNIKLLNTNYEPKALIVTPYILERKK